MREVEIRSLARVEEKPFSDSSTIDSNNLDAYLIAMSFVARESQFASHLDLRQHTPILEKLYAETQEAFVFPEENRAKTLEMVEWIRKNSSRINLEDPAIEKFIHELETGANMVASVERSSIVYFDTGEEAIKASPVKFGTFAEVETSILDVLEEGKRAMIEIHTHPSDNLFSLADYYFMLIDLDEGTPLVKSAIVLCPNIQVLAFVTRESPLVNMNEADDLMETLDKNLNEDIPRERIDLNEERILANTRSLAIGRALGVKLYSSTDMWHFKEFSA